MFESKYSKVLTVILVIVVVAIVGLLGYLAYDYYMNYIKSSEAEDFVNNFQSDSTGFDDFSSGDGENDENNGINWDDLNLSDGTQNSGTQGSTSTKKPQYKGYDMLGTISIPATKCEYPILERNTTATLETGIVFIWGTGINKPGNTVLAGHNYRNGLFFSNNKKLKVGDKIYLTDNSKQKLTYTIYNKFETTDTDTSFYQRDTGGVAEVTLSTCTDNGKNRLIILAKQD